MTRFSQMHADLEADLEEVRRKYREQQLLISRQAAAVDQSYCGGAV